MASWGEFAAAEPGLAERVKGRLEAGVHKTLATIRADGAPRISGNEAWFAGDDLWFGSMPDSARARDLRRDPRFALHSASADPPGWAGEPRCRAAPRRSATRTASRGPSPPSTRCPTGRGTSSAPTSPRC